MINKKQQTHQILDRLDEIKKEDEAENEAEVERLIKSMNLKDEDGKMSRVEIEKERTVVNETEEEDDDISKGEWSMIVIKKFLIRLCN